MSKPVSENQRARTVTPKGNLGNRRTGRESDGPIRVVIADDHALVRQGLRKILMEVPGSFEICGEAVNGLEAVSKVRQMRPDVVVLDLSMPYLNGLETTRLIVKEVPGTEILILTMHQTEALTGEIL
jgi:DNA-binding NarL/FixJ family response regulator